MKRRLALLLVVAAAAPVGAARANGDPASDVLPFNNVFLSLQKPEDSGSGRELLALTADAEKKKYPIKVAVIAQQDDLGLILSLWKKPQAYADFLGRELVAFARYRGTLIVAMPDGFGVHGPGATPGGKRALKSLTKPGTDDLDDLGKAASVAVRRVALANGKTLAASSGSGTPAWTIALSAAVGAALIGWIAFVALRRWLIRGS